MVTAAANGYVQSRFGSTHYEFPGSPLVVSSGQQEEIYVLIDRAPIVMGVVRDDLGKPIENASVTILGPSVPSVSEGRVIISATTDAAGLYRIGGLTPGEFLAVATSTQPTRVAEPSKVQTPSPQFFPGTPLEDQATRIVLQPNQERSGVDFVLPRRPLTLLTGTIVPPQGVKLFDGPTVIVTGANGFPPTWDSPSVVTGTRFEQLVHKGRYRVDIRAMGRRIDQPQIADGRVYVASMVIDIDEAGAISREIHLREGLRISGFVQAVRLSGLRVRFSPSSLRRPAALPAEATVSEDGRFTVEGIVPGRYACELVDLEGGARPSRVLDTLRFRGRVQTDPLISVEDTVDSHELELVVASATASLTGVVQGIEDGFSSYLLGLVPEGSIVQGKDAPPRYLTRPDNRGNYTFKNLRPGPYLLFLIKDADPAYLKSARFQDSLRGSTTAGAARVMLLAGTETRLPLRVGGHGLHIVSRAMRVVHR